MKKNGLHIDEFGTKIWYKDGLVHREDGPAIIWPDDSNFWYKNGKYHREDGPAAIYPNGTRIWYKYNIRHRDDGPAVTYPDGSQEWWKNNEPYEPSAHDLMVWKMNERRTTH